MRLLRHAVLAGAVTAVGIGGLARSAGAQAQEPSGHATGVDVIVETIVETIDLPPTPFVEQPPGGSDSLSSLDVPPAITSGILSVSSERDGDAVSSSASVADADAALGTVSAALITSACSADPTGAAADSAIVDGTFAGTDIPVGAPANTEITVPGVGSVILNEQTTSAGGVTVRAVHAVIDTPVLSADIVISESACVAGTSVIEEAPPASETPTTPNLAG